MSSSISYLPISMESFNDDRVENILLNFEQYSIYSYVLNKYYPNDMIDYYDSGFYIDGSMNLPIFQSIPEKIYFDTQQLGTITQLSFKQKKSDLYFDTNIGFKTDLNSKTRFILKAESKSIEDNVNQNYVLSFNKKDKNNEITLGYMYHIEDDPYPITFNNINQYFDKINHEIESFHLGANYRYFNKKVSLNHISSIQISNNERLIHYGNIEEENMKYDYQVFWNQNKIRYNINRNINMFLNNNFKKYIYENNSELSQSPHLIKTTGSRNHSFLGVEYILNSNLLVEIGSSHYNKNFLPTFKINYLINDISFSLINDFQVIDEIETEEISLESDFMLIGNITYNLMKNKRIQFSYKGKNSSNSIILGDIGLPKMNYQYLIIDGSISYKWLTFEYNYNYYSSKLTCLKEYLKSSFIISPLLENKRFRPYGKISNNYLSFNKQDIVISGLNLFIDDINQTHTEGLVNLVDLEFGFIFESFKISFIRKNLMELEDYLIDEPNVLGVQFTENIIFPRYDYLHLIWYFQD